MYLRSDDLQQPFTIFVAADAGEDTPAVGMQPAGAGRADTGRRAGDQARSLACISCQDATRSTRRPFRASSLLLSALSTQCPSSGKTIALLGTPLRRSAVKSCRP